MIMSLLKPNRPQPFRCTCRKYFNESIQSLVESVVASTVEIYNSIRAELLPTPSNSHYTFNLRDLAKVRRRFISRRRFLPTLTQYGPLKFEHL